MRFDFLEFLEVLTWKFKKTSKNCICSEFWPTPRILAPQAPWDPVVLKKKEDRRQKTEEDGKHKKWERRTKNE